MTSVFNKKSCQVKKYLAQSFSDIAHRPRTFVAKTHGAVIGVVQCHMYPKDKSYFAIACLAVAPAHRKQGVGRALMQHTEKYISKSLLKGKAGAVLLVDETKENNPASIFYENLGYLPEPEPRHVDGLPILIKRLKWKN